MKRLISWSVLALIGVVLAPGCIIVVDGDGHDDCDDGQCEDVDIVQQYSAPDFSSLTMTGSASVQVNICDCDTEIMLTDDADSSNIRSDGGQLTISGSGSEWWGKPAIFVNTRTLSRIVLSGSGTLRVSKLQGESLSLQTSGSGDVTLRGKTKSLSITATGSSDINADRLKTKNTNLTSTGSANISVCATDSVSGMITGSGDLDVYCDPESVSVQSTGSGNVDSH